MGEDEQSTWTFSIKMPDGTSIPFSGTIESAEVADMERKVKVGDKIRIIKPWMTNGRYEKGDVLTVRIVYGAGVWVVENDWYIDQKEFEVITDEIKVGDKVTLIDRPWEWDGWAQLDRKRRCAYSEMIGEEIEVLNIYRSPSFPELKGIPSANTGVWFIPLAILRKIEPGGLPFDFEPEPVKEEIKYRNGTVGRYSGGKFRPVAFKDGDLIKRLEDAHDGFWPLWVRESDGLCQRCKDGWVEPVKAEPKRVPMTDEPHPEIKEGARFVVVNKPDNPNLKIGDVLVLYKNDHSSCPFFYHNEARRCEYWKNLAPVEAKHRYTDEQITEAKCYLAESMVSMKDRWTITKPTEAYPVAVISGPLGTGKAKCAPDDEFNVYIGLMVAFKRYHNEPLPTWIRG